MDYKKNNMSTDKEKGRAGTKRARVTTIIHFLMLL
jgi:hypothetical protein